MGYKLFYKKKGSAGPQTRLVISSVSTLTKTLTGLVINDGGTLNKTVTGLDKFTEYAFQVLAFTSVGDGPTSSVNVERTKEDGKRHVIKCYKPYYTCLYRAT